MNAYTYIVPSTPVGANKRFFDIFNAVGSGVTMKVKSIRPIADTDVAVAALVGVRLVVMRTSSVGTGGTVWSYMSPTLDVAGGTISPLDTNSPALPAQVTGRHLSTGGATDAEWLRGMYMMTANNSNSQAYVFQGEFNMLQLNHPSEQYLTVREGQGIVVRQGGIASLGNIRFRVTFSLE